MTCSRIHIYTIVTQLWGHQRFETLEAARETYNQLKAEGQQPYWVAHHPTPIQQLVDCPDDIVIYCAIETYKQENRRKISLVKI